ncbi:quercetin 2,3-dioxygenase protein [Trichomonas vaginalis G3]|uniref:quercetin 2,3-dioxygenase protein n=1 Tax=Trichomonas vaginalis (strain ATCC PRA-98 / G3) TaxID=412133 RepID=UPI0021E54096|nr:quercetin 2,3-dioxygenase protein [Trichomonas vaginalis G3]KAI5513700.1 quercetin 2,3-dioxygenase protein [Trichomonas vaginalis G3]
MFEGSADFSKNHDGKQIDAKQAVLFTLGKMLSIKAGQQGLRMIVLSGPSIHEPIAWAGPIVMNTREEILQAYKELDYDTFLKHKRN